MTSARVSQVIIGVYVDDDGKEEGTELGVVLNLADCSRVGQLDLSGWQLHESGDGDRRAMDLDSAPTRAKMEEGARVRFRWSPRGRDSFHGRAVLEIKYDDGAAETYSFDDLKFGREKEWYIFPLSAPEKT